MRTIHTLSILALAAAATAQSPRFAQVGDPLPDGMGQLVGAADFEGDGDVDLFTTTGVFLNKNGYFTAGPVMPASFVPTTNVRSIAVADLTGDGRVDVLIGRAGGAPAGLALYAAPPVGGTAFVAVPGAFSGAILMHELAVLDFDADGDMDVIAAASSTATPAWQLFVNNGTGTFAVATPAQWPAAPLDASWVGAGDFDNDGLTDVCSTGSSGAVWRRNLGGLFSPTLPVGSSLVADQGAVGDFDGDGDADVYVASVTGTEAVFLGSPAGLAVGSTGFGGILGPPPVAADLNDDGFDDLLRTVVEVSGGAVGDQLVRFGSAAGLGSSLGLGKATFAYGNPMPYPGAAVLDVDGDADPDLALVTGLGAPGLVINSVTGFAFAQQTIPYGFGSLFAPPHDVDGDGDVDLLRASLGSGVVSLEVLRNDGRGVFTGPFPAGSYAGFAGRAVWSDLDGDGDSDLWVTTSGGLAVGVAIAVLNNGSGVFSGAASVANPGPTSALAAGDFEGDGVPDIVVGRGWTAGFPPIFNQPMLIRGSLPGGVLSYAPAVPFGVAEAITEVVTLDVEPDGDLDLLVATTGLGGAGTPRLYLNDGFGGFTAAAPFAGVTARTVAAAELTGDSLIDLVLGSQVWVQTALGFVAASSHAEPIGLLSVADVDLDGVLDLVDSAGRWYAGTIAAAFGAPATFVPYAPAAPITFAPSKAVVADFDADGDPDLVGPENVPGSLFSIYSNLTRHAGRAALVVQNAPLDLAVFGAPGDFWVLAGSFAGTPPVPLPPLGTLFLDPNSLGIFGSGFLPVSGRADVAPFVVPGLPGFSIAWQALVGPLLSNGFETLIP